MNYKRVFDAVSSEFSVDVALMVTQMATINTSVYPSDSEVLGESSFTERLISIFDDILWEQKNNDYDQYSLAISIWKVVYDWEMCQDMHGLLSCEKKTFTELLYGV